MASKQTWNSLKDRKYRTGGEDFASQFLFETLTKFYKHLLSYNLTEPKDIRDKYVNPNPLMLLKVYDEREILLIYYMINENLISVVVKEKRPLLIKGSITKKGLDFLLIERVFDDF